jgi:ABC-type lipoprotein release transport system permease subunit
MLTVLGIALVIAVAVILLAYSRGLIYSMRNSGDVDNVIALSRKAENKIFSSMSSRDFEVLNGLVSGEAAVMRLGPEVKEEPKKESGGEEEVFDPEAEEKKQKTADTSFALVAPYLSHTTLIDLPDSPETKEVRKMAFVVGIDTKRAYYMMSKFKMLEGSALDALSGNAAIVGAMAYARFGVKKADLAIGRQIVFNGKSWKIAGIFSVEGTAYESEIWVPLDELMAVLNRSDYSFAMVKVKREPGETDAEVTRRAEKITTLILNSEQMELKATTEMDFFKEINSTFRTFALIGMIMAGVITVGGIMAGMNTMYTAVSGRIREIGMLQVIGFSKRSIVGSFLAESVLIALAGGAIGCLLGSLVNDIPMQITMTAFTFRVDEFVVAGGLVLALAIGFIGALLPAMRAVRLRMVDAMRYI